MVKAGGTIGKQFADITALLEDAHCLAVEGQGHNLTTCEVHYLQQSLRLFSARLVILLNAISTYE